MGLKKIFFFAFFAIAILGVIFLVLLNLPGTPQNNATVFGVTFTHSYAQQFGYDWRKAYIAILDDLKVRQFRLSAHWNEVEPYNGVYDFDDLDFQMNEAAGRDAHVILGVGRKLPRWPECHDPAWITLLSQDEREKKLLEDITTIVNRYKNHPVLSNWQVENEFLFPFGACEHPFGLGTLKKEIDLVQKLDPKHPIIITDSGEWTIWMPLALYGDTLGISMYREAWNDMLHVSIPFPVKEGWYQFRAKLVSPWKKNIIVTELQAEPWVGKPVEKMTAEEGVGYMSLEKIQDNITFARNVGFSEVYLWGVEWWYWLKINDSPDIWEGMKKVFYEQ